MGRRYMRKRLIIWLLLNAILVDFFVAAPGDSVTLGGAKYVASPSDKHFETALDEITDFINVNYTVADIVKYGERVYTSNWKKYRELVASVIIRNDDMDIKIMMVVEQRLPYFFYRKGDGDLRIAMDYLSYPYDYDRHEYDEYKAYCIGIEKNIDSYMRKKEWICESRDFIFDNPVDVIGFGIFDARIKEALEVQIIKRSKKFGSAYGDIECSIAGQKKLAG
ncbi:MAG: hypothetical protein HDR33_05565 [Treponema sp.]|nr:hypothetical protein [Treponema sp.]